jgi:DNA repair exonuclease SbcCD ATPase subunit
MRIHFKRIRYKNTLSTGNSFTTIDLDRKPTTLVSGSNGSGKSTMLDAIVYGLYGKPFRKINKPQLVNSINKKDQLVEIDFSVGGNNYKIKRGMYPSVFEIWKDGELINQDSAKRDYQGYLETNILGINYKSFNQIVILGSATYVPFMELSVGQRRDIIEDLLDIQVFSTMNLLVKDKISDNKTTISENGYEIDIVQAKIESAAQSAKDIRVIREAEVTKIKEKMGEHISNIEMEKDKIESIEDKVSSLIETTSDKQSVQNKNEKAKALKRDLENTLNAHKKELSFYHDHDNCPTCKQGIDHEFKEKIITEKGQKSGEVEEGIKDLSEKLEGYQVRLDEISKVDDDIRDQSLMIQEHKAHIRLAKNALKEFKTELEKAEMDVDEVDTSKLEKFKGDLKSYQEDRQELFNQKDVLGVVSAILKDGGIKAKIIRQYIPVMNKLINKYLAAFDLFVDFQLDENFNEIIKSRFRDTFSYASFSEGEKLRITLSIMLSWRAVAKLRNSVSTNLLILDETLDGAMDNVGVENLIETLHNLNTDDNIFVISHRGDQFAEKFTSHIKFHKIKNFSEIAA